MLYLAEIYILVIVVAVAMASFCAAAVGSGILLMRVVQSLARAYVNVSQRSVRWLAELAGDAGIFARLKSRFRIHHT